MEAQGRLWAEDPGSAASLPHSMVPGWGEVKRNTETSRREGLVVSCSLSCVPRQACGPRDVPSGLRRTIIHLGSRKDVGMRSLLVSRLPALVPPLRLEELRGAVHSPEACAAPRKPGRAQGPSEMTMQHLPPGPPG